MGNGDKKMMGLSFAVLISLATPQGHDLPLPEAMKSISFLIGDWTGKQDFVTGGDPLVGDVKAKIHEAIGGRYIEESLAVTLPGRKPSDTRHFMTYDPKSGHFKAWWFNDSAVGAMEFEGALQGSKLIMESKPVSSGSGGGTIFRVTYENGGPTSLTYMLEIKAGDGWTSLFKTTYTKPAK